MEPFVKLAGHAAPMPMSNVDTDMITPSYVLKTVTKTGLAWALFREMRIDGDGNEKPDHVLNQPPWREAKIIVAHENFGCGSSREHAPWALLDFGIRSIIAVSFGDIFHANCYKNGVLPVSLPREQVDRVMVDAQAGLIVEVDLPGQQVLLADGTAFPFEITALRKRCLLNGLDDIGLTVELADRIEAFERRQKQQLPWLHERTPLA